MVNVSKIGAAVVSTVTKSAGRLFSKTAVSSTVAKDAGKLFSETPTAMLKLAKIEYPNSVYVGKMGELAKLGKENLGSTTVYGGAKEFIKRTCLDFGITTTNPNGTKKTSLELWRALVRNEEQRGLVKPGATIADCLKSRLIDKAPF